MIYEGSLFSIGNKNKSCLFYHSYKTVDGPIKEIRLKE